MISFFFILNFYAYLVWHTHNFIKVNDYLVKGKKRNYSLSLLPSSWRACSCSWYIFFNCWFSSWRLRNSFKITKDRKCNLKETNSTSYTYHSRIGVYPSVFIKNNCSIYYQLFSIHLIPLMIFLKKTTKNK